MASRRWAARSVPASPAPPAWWAVRCRAEICIRQGRFVRGDTLFAGYFQEGELVRRAGRGGLVPHPGQGRLTAEGELVVEGRLDNLFISGARTSSPRP